MAASGRIALPEVALPKGGGAFTGLGERVRPDAFTGTASLTIPLPVSACRGLEPRLSLAYHSGAGNGLFGIGFGLTLPSIARQTARAIPAYDETDTFLLDQADDLVPVAGDLRTVRDGAATYIVARFRPRVERHFSRIERWVREGDGDTHWRTITAEHVTSIYGATDAARIADPADRARVFQWLVERTYDARGDQVAYLYREEGGNKHPQTIKYGNYGARTTADSDDWHFTIDFAYSRPATGDDPPADAATDAARARPDPFSSYKPGFALRTAVRCVRIALSHRFAGVNGGQRFVVSATDCGYDDAQALSLLTTVSHVGYREAVAKALPPLDFSWSRFDLGAAVATGATAGPVFAPLRLSPDRRIPAPLEQGGHQLVDLYGDGLPGLLTSGPDTLLYARPLGDGRFAPPAPPQTFPLAPDLHGAGGALLDLAGDGTRDLVVTTPAHSGYYAARPDGGWEPFRSFAATPTDLASPHRQLVDVTGDGLLDLLFIEGDRVRFYPSRGELGYDGPRTQALTTPLPVADWPDEREVVRFANLLGDGGSHLVRIRDGGVECWPNLGHGRFGPRFALANAPRFGQDLDAARLFLADLDGSGTADLIYAHPDRLDIYRNQSGNRFDDPVAVPLPWNWNALGQISFADVLGNGTACLIFTSVQPDLRLEHWYCDFTGGAKPYLLTGVENNLGAATRITYRPSTAFALADARAGTPWITRLPFPVQVVAQTETTDRIGGSTLVARYSYHHGYFDPFDREFRGFGRVERQDAETLDAAAGPGQAHRVPPILTKTWYHTGALAEAGVVSRQLAAEYYRGDAQAPPLPDSVFDPAFRAWPENGGEGYRALHGAVLREEVYGLDPHDNPARSAHPYLVTESNYAVRLVQPRVGAGYAACFVAPRETLTYHYERNPADPRIAHALTLEVDAFGNARKSLAIAYGRRAAGADPALSADDRARQEELAITYRELVVTNAVETAEAYRAPLPAEARTYELTGFTPGPGRERFSIEEWTRDQFALLASATEIPFEQVATHTAPQRRLFECVRTLYRPDDLGTAARDDALALLPLGTLEGLALLGETYTLALTPGLLRRCFGPRLPAQPEALLAGGGPGRGGYVDLDGDGCWWQPSGRLFFSPERDAPAARELAYARAHFFLPHRLRDPFHATGWDTEHAVAYDDYDLLVRESRDALGNVTVFENDYRVLRPHLVTDPNGNRSAVAFDALGLVVGTAVLGKPAPAAAEGDSLDGFAPDPPDAALRAYLDDPLADPQALLGRATARLVYDLFAYRRTRDQPQPQPTVVATIARETHDAALAGGQQTRVLHHFAYADGFGRDMQRKSLAAAGPVPQRDAQGQPALAATAAGPRWVGTGWTVFNNKGQPARRFEPFFSDTHRCEFAVAGGASTIFCYDPAERLVATLHADHTWAKVVFDPWRQATWDANDTVLADPGADADVGAYVRRLPATAYLPTWHDQRRTGQRGAEAQAAADKAAAHADTPTVAHADALGRTFLTVADNGQGGGGARYAATRTLRDIAGHQRELGDANGRVAARYDYDLRGNLLHEASMEAGERWVLPDATGRPLSAWDSRGQRVRTEYDPLRRPLRSFVAGADAADPAREVLAERTVYGEQHPEAARRNLRGQPYLQLDQAGAATTEAYDFKGHPIVVSRRLATDYTDLIDWGAAAAALPTAPTVAFDPVAFAATLAGALEPDTYTSRTRHDALDRPVEVTAPDGSSIHSAYNEAGLLARVAANLRGAGAATPFIANIEYDARGQRTRVDLGNGVSTTFAYDPETFHLARLHATRATDTDALQDLRYTYDPAGNITTIRDDAQQTHFFRNRRVEPRADFTYDARYRLIAATGREHLGQAGGTPIPHSANDAPRVGLPQPGDGNALGRYVEQYRYDAVGNLLTMQHRSDAGAAGWTRDYTYGEASLIEPTVSSNRLSRTTVGGATPVAEAYAYDAHGNLTAMPHLALLRWDYRDQLRATARRAVGGGAAETTWYTYDATGQRVRAVTGRQAAGQSATRQTERIYLGGFELYREYARDGATVDRATETLHLADDHQRVALVETRTAGAGKGPPQRIRYQLGNHLGSACLELDDRARLISYEEYTPFGSTAYQAVRGQLDAPKRYRYSGKERDEATGFYYYGARYLAPWLGRWISPDPAGMVDGPNLYAFVGGNPITYLDRMGHARSRGLLLERDASGTLRGTGRPKFGSHVKSLSIEIARRRDGYTGSTNLVLANMASPHRLSWENLRHETTAYLNDATPAVEARFRQFTSELVAASRSSMAANIAHLSPQAQQKWTRADDAFERHTASLLTAKAVYAASAQSGADLKTLEGVWKKFAGAINNLPGNVAGLSPHTTVNVLVSDRLHLNTQASKTPGKREATPFSAAALKMRPLTSGHGRGVAMGSRGVLDVSGRQTPISDFIPAHQALLAPSATNHPHSFVPGQ